MNHAQVAHVWANQGKPRAKGSNMFFEGATIYSWGTHFPIATFVQNEDGERAVLFTRKDYSVSTHTHKRLASDALNGLDIPVFYAEPSRVTIGGGVNADLLARELNASFDRYLEDAREAAQKAKRSRKYGRYLLETVRGNLDGAERLSTFFKLGREVPPLSLLISEEEISKMDKRAEEENARQEERYQKRTAQRAEEDRLRAIRRAEQEAAQRIEDAGRFEAWKRGEGSYCPHSYATDENGSAYMRIKDTAEGRIVQTSRGAEVPLADAVKAFRFVKLCKELGRAFRANGSQVPVGSFALRTVDTNGNVQVGCHYLTWQRIQDLAEAGGFFEDAPSEEAVKHSAA